MKAILYLYRCRIKNWFRQSLHKPARLILVAVMAGLLIMMLLTTGKSEQPANQGLFTAQVPMFFSLIMWGLAALISFPSFIAGTKNGSLQFSQADTHYIFTGPFLPQNVLLYGLMNTAGSTLFSTVFFWYQIPNLRAAGFTLPALLLTFAFLILGIFVVSLVQQAIYLTGSNHEGFRKPFRTLMIVLLAAAAGAILFYFIRRGTVGGLAKLFTDEKLCLLVPVVGWWSRLLMIGLLGFDRDTVICLLLLLAAAVLSVLYSYHTKADFYEEATERAELVASVKQSQKSIGAAPVHSDKKYKLHAEGLGHGLGESTFFWMHFHEYRRQKPYFVSLTMAVQFLTAAVITYFAKMQNLSDRTGFFIYIWTGIGIVYLFSQNTPLLLELKHAFFYYAPGRPLKKILWVSLCPLVIAAINLAPGLLLLTVFLDVPLLWKLLAIPLILSFTLVVLSIQLIVLLILGTFEGTVASLIYAVFFYLFLAPGLTLTIIAFAMNSRSPAIAFFFLGALLFHLLFFMLSTWLGVRVLKQGIEN